MGKGLSKVASVGLTVAGIASGTGWFTGGFFKGVGLVGLNMALGGGASHPNGPRLEDLGVQLAAEGADLPRGWGAWRQSGVMVWCPGLDEHEERHSAGKGGKKYSDYSYTTSLMLVCGRGPITRINRIRLNERVVYDYNGGNEKPFIFEAQGSGLAAPPDVYDDAAQSWMVSGANSWLRGTRNVGIRAYLGHINQPVDPKLEAVKGAGRWTNYPGLWGLFFEDLELEDYGNSVPNITVEPFNAVTDLPSVVAEICAWRGLGSGDLDLSQLEGLKVVDRPDEGYVVSTRRAASAALEELGYLFNFALRERDGVLEAIRRGRASVAVLGGRELTAHLPGGERVPVEEKRADERELALAGEMQFSDAGREYNPGSRLATVAGARDESGMGARGGRRDSVSIPVSTRGGKALRAAKIALLEKWTRAEAYSLSLGWRHLRLAAGDPITIETPNGPREVYLPQINQPFWGPIGTLAPRQDRLLYTLGENDDGEAMSAPIPDGTHTPIAFAIDMAALSESSPDMVSKPGLLLVATQIAGREWKGADCKIEQMTVKDNQVKWDKVKTETLNSRAVAGYTRAPWTPRPPEAGYTSDNPLAVTMYNGELFSVEPDAVRAGANVIAFETGLVVSFEVAEGDGPSGNCVLTGLKSGRWGSDYAEVGIETPQANRERIGFSIPVGTRFVLLVDDEGQRLNAAKWTLLEEKRIGQELRITFTPRKTRDASEYEVQSQFTFRARNLQPLSPAGVHATRDDAGGLRLDGRARTRIADDGAWNSPQPGRLSERPTAQGYKYQFVLSSGNASAPVTLYTTDERASFDFSWSAAQLATLLGRTPAQIAGAPLSGSVALWSDVVGFGRASEFSI